MSFFSNFRFIQTQGHRRLTLTQVMPVGREWTYFVVLANAYLRGIDGVETSISSLDDLRDVLACDDELQALQGVRTSGRISEGRRELPDVLASHLANACSGELQVRRWIFGASVPIIDTLAPAEIKDGWAAADFEEVEVCDLNGQWYFRTRDDEPLVFLAVRAGPLLDQVKQCRQHCREVAGTFEYAR